MFEETSESLKNGEREKETPESEHPVEGQESCKSRVYLGKSKKILGPVYRGGGRW